MSAAPQALRPPSTSVPPAPAAGAPSGRTSPSADLSKRFDKTVIYDNFDLDIPRGELISVFGPNGCGKSTLINMIAGLIPPDAGQILFDGRRLDEIKFGYVFQNYREALFPWLRAFDNIAYPLKMMQVATAERRARTEKLVAHLGIKLDLNLYPYQMSGGQQQLVSILRALMVEPEILFLDEPFSALDYEMTLFMREQLQRIFHGDRHHHDAGVARSGRGGVSRRPRAAVVAASGAGRRFHAGHRGAAAHRRDAVRSGIRAHQGALPRRVSARGAAAHEDAKRRSASCRSSASSACSALWSLVIVAAMGRSGAAAVAGRDFQVAVARHGRRPARLRFRQDRVPDRGIDAIAAVIAIPLGIVLGSSERLYRSLEFVIDFFRSTPASAMFPLFLVLFGVGDETKISVAAFGAILVILFNVAYGVMNARKTRLLAAKVMGASRLRVLFDVMLLESLPQTFVGLRNGVSLALVIIVVAEMFIGSQDGLGHSVFEAQQLFDMPRMYAAIFAAGALGYGLNLLFLLIERRFVHWSGK